MQTPPLTYEALLYERDALRQRNAALEAVIARGPDDHEWAHAALASLAGAVYVEDRAGNLTFVNAAFARLTGYRASALLGTPASRYYVPEAEAVLAAHRRQALHGEEVPAGLETVLLGPEGRQVPVELAVSALHLEGQTVGCVVLLHDHTARQRTEAQLRESATWLQLALNAGRMGVWEWDVESHALRWDPAQYALLGLDPGLTPLTDDDFFRRLHPDDLPAMRQALEAMLAQSGELEAEFRVCHPDGAVRWLMGRGRVIRDAQGQPTQVVGVTFDITDRKQMEDALRASEARAQQQLAELQLIYYTAPVGLCVLSPELRFLRMNEHLAAIGGLPVQAHLGKTVPEVLPALAPKLEPLFQQVLATGEPLRAVEVSGETPAQPGVSRTWRQHLVPQTDAAGWVVSINVVVEEITEQKRAEAALLESEARFRLLADSAPVLIWATDAAGESQFRNQSCLLYTGCTSDELQGSGWARLVHPDDVHAYVGALQAALARRQRFEAQYRLQRADGVYRWMQAVALPRLLPDGTFLGYVGCSFDITDQRQANEELERRVAERTAALQASEARLRQVAEALPVGFWLSDREFTRLLYANPAFEAILGRPRALFSADLAAVWACVHPEDRARAQAEVRCRSRGVFAPIEYRIVHPDGSLRWVRARGFPIRDAQGEIVRLAGIVTDVTAQKQAEAERQRLERVAQRAEHFALLGRLAASVSHELRNPLGAVVLNVDLLAEELHDLAPDAVAGTAETLVEIRSNLARVDDLIQDYLSLARLSTLQREVQDLGAALQGWAVEFQALATARGLRLEAEGLAEVGAVACHANTLRRALLNLVQNALDATAPGGTLTLRGRGTATHVELQVADTGSGIPAARLQQIFEPLHTTKPGGTGLGLYIVQEIVTAHEGQIGVESVEGHGTTFTLTLPRAATAAVASE